MCLPKATGTYQMGVGQLLNFQFEGKNPLQGGTQTCRPPRFKHFASAHFERLKCIFSSVYSMQLRIKNNIFKDH